MPAQRIWITGASKGIGAAIARRLIARASPKTTLILSARNEALLSNVADDCAAASVGNAGAVHCVACDVADAASVRSAWQTIEQLTGGVDVLVNNAGVGTFAPLMDLSVEEFDAMVNVNLRGAWMCIKMCLPQMIAQRSGTIVNINSIAATTTFTGATGYAASKAGLLALSRSLRQEVRDFGVKVLDVLPGATATDIWHPDALAEHRERMMHADDVAEALVALLALDARVMPEELVLRPQRGDL
jgi:3-oxoacyl-[acyl-carrier protein] reductase